MKLENGRLYLTNDEVRYEIDAYWDERVDCFDMWMEAELDEHDDETSYKRVYSKGEFIGDFRHTGSDPWEIMYEVCCVLLDEDLANEYGNNQYPLYDAEFDMDYDYFFKKAEEAWKACKDKMKKYNCGSFRVVVKKDEVVFTRMKAKKFKPTKDAA